MKSFELYNGVRIPAVCYGPGIVYDNRNMLMRLRDRHFSYRDLLSFYDNRKKQRAIACSYEAGYRAFDTSAAYADCERLVGESLRGKARKEIFITTKISNRQQRSGNVASNYSRTIKSMGLSYVDLYLIHWPMPGYLDTWRQMEELYMAGKVRAIGVCNFQMNHFEELMKIAQVKPMVHQFEVHPLFTQEELCRYCSDNGILTMAYTPVARCDDRLMNSSELKKLALMHGKSIVQIILRWHYQKGHVSVLSSGNIGHLRSNLLIFDFVLSDREMRLIDGMNINSRLRYDSNNCNFKDL